MENNIIKETARKYYLKSYRTNLVIDHGDGNLLYDDSGNFYIDFIAGRGENILGYNVPELHHAIEEQSKKLINISDMYFNDTQSQLISTLLEGTSFKKVLLVMNGFEALSASIQMIRNYYRSNKIKKNAILVVTDSIKTLSLGKSFVDQYSGTMNIKFTPQNDFEKFRQNLTDDVGAIVLETIQVENSMNMTSYDFMLNAYALAKSKGAFIIMNELVTGVGRTGYMFSYEPTGIQPDIVIISKGLGAGLPISAVLATKAAASCYNAENSSVFYTNPLACAAANVVMSKLKNGLMEKVIQIGDYLKAKLSKFSKYNFILDIKGNGLIIGIELSHKLNAKEVVGRMEKEGILIGNANKNTLIFTPPYTITRQDIDFMCEKLGAFFASTNI